MPDLKLIALEASDLEVLSAHLQDAVVRMEDMTFLKRERRFLLVVNRFDWSDGQKVSKKGEFTRRRSGVRIEQVLRAQTLGINLGAKDQVLSLLSIGFEGKADDPAGHVVLTFAGGGLIRLEVDCVEAAMEDLGAAWTTQKKPVHPGTEAEG